jgi:hypothetical protein
MDRIIGNDSIEAIPPDHYGREELSFLLPFPEDGNA